MRSGRGNGRTITRSIATVMAATGALLVSSGIALGAVHTTAPAAHEQHQPVSVCHATSSDTNPYVYQVVDNDSVKLKGHLQHKTDPNKAWKSATTWNGTAYPAGASKRDFIGSYTDESGTFHQEDGVVTEEWCTSGAVPETATADVVFADPTCDNGNVGTAELLGDHVGFTVPTSTPGPGEDTYLPGTDILVLATADEGYAFEDGSRVQQFTWTFGPVVAGCTVVPPVTPPVVNPPVVNPPVVNPPEEGGVVTPTVVHAGLAGPDSSGAARFGTGFGTGPITGLVTAGAVLIAAAGGLGAAQRRWFQKG